MTASTKDEGNRVLIAAPFGRDADSVAELLDARGHVTVVCPTLSDLAGALDDRTGAVIMTEEALGADPSALEMALEAQPPWSDVPVVLLAVRQTGVARAAELARLRLPASATNVVVLERPLGSVSLLSAVGSALRARRRQFEMRDRLAELAASALNLSASRVAVEASERELRLIADSMPILIAFVDRDCRCRFANRAYEDWFDRKTVDIVGLAAEEALAHEALELGAALKQAMAGAQVEHQCAWPHFDGRRRDAHIRYLPRVSAAGAVDGVHVFVIDITERRMAEEVLRQAAETLEEQVAERTAALHAEMASRSHAEAALRQSQKMEAVGQLTGGIAHDFNNMLTGVIGSIDIMRRRIASGRFDDMERYMEAASVSAQRAASLTQRLLAFSRRQSLDSRPLDINVLVGSLHDLLSRTISERIQLEVALADDLPPGVADANQLESAILNLAINARDAMPHGGQLTVETSVVDLDEAYAAARPDINPGRYVVVAVSDTGVGIDPKILDKVIEPFFTTKPIGQGTGLGLSMVYGFAKQSNGQVVIHSKLGQGTSVKIYLPAAAAGGPAGVAETPSQEAKHGRGLTVLVVEDDDSVRLLIREILLELGYVAIEASDSRSAIPILLSARPVHLMISDVGLPGLNGRQLAEIARRHRPDLPILFATGYAENATIRSGFLGSNMRMVTKPFSFETLAGKIGEMLTGAGKAG